MFSSLLPPGAVGVLKKSGLLATRQGLLGVQQAEKLDGLGHEAGPFLVGKPLFLEELVDGFHVR